MENIFDNWDDFLFEDQKRQNRLEAKKIRQDIFKTKIECGSCSKWMIKNSCPRENDHHKVTCGEYKCNDFEMSKWYIDFIERQELKAKQLEQ